MPSLAQSSLNGVKIYNLSSGKTLPQWMSQKKKRSLAKDEEYRKRVELVQDFHFGTASQCVKMSNDQNYIVAAGTYPPSIKVFDVRDLSLKFERRLDCNAVRFEILSEDFGKLAILQADRNLVFHAPYGTHYSLRIPKFGRDMSYHQGNCDLYVGASGCDIYRVNLDQGRFLAPFESKSNGINVVKLNPIHQLLACGGEQGLVEFWDPRSHQCAASLDLAVPVAKHLRDLVDQIGVTALGFKKDGLTFAAGTSTGHCLLFDLRYPVPLLIKDHQYGLPLLDLHFHDTSNKILSTDSKIIKIWDALDGTIFTNIETPADINDVCVVQGSRGDSGTILAAGEQSRVMSYYIPELGYAPKWCSFLDSLTEELEEEAQATVYEDYKFVTKDELNGLGLTHLIGTSVLKAYMHGFFMDSRLYTKAKSVLEPFAYDTWRKQRVKEKIEEKQANRISIKKRLPKVNRETAERLLHTKKRGKDPDNDSDRYDNPLGDDRFSKMFSSTDFQVDQECDEYKRHHPTHYAMSKKNDDQDSDDDHNDQVDVLGDRFRIVSDDENDDDYEIEGKESGLSSSEEENEENEENEHRENNKDSRENDRKISTTSSKKFKLYQVADGESLKDVVGFGKKHDLQAQLSLNALQNVTLAERMKETALQDAERSQMKYSKDQGSMRELSFIPGSKRKASSENYEERKHQKRGVKELRLQKAWDGNRRGKGRTGGSRRK